MKSLSFVVCAAGRSQRFKEALRENTKGSFVSKQFVSWANLPLFIHTLKALEKIEIKEGVFVVSPGTEADYEPWLEKENLSFNWRIIEGGERRQDSVRNGLQALSDCDVVAIHDGARPFVTQELLTRLLDNIQTASAVIPGIPIFETIKEVDASNFIVTTHDRSKLIRVQTPQVFDFKTILKVHQDLASSNQEFTDDAAMVEYFDIPVKMVSGESTNIKVTIPDDLEGRGLEVNYA